MKICICTIGAGLNPTVSSVFARALFYLLIQKQGDLDLFQTQLLNMEEK